MPARTGGEEMEVALTAKGAEKCLRGQSRSMEIFYRYRQTLEILQVQVQTTSRK